MAYCRIAHISSNFSNVNFLHSWKHFPILKNNGAELSFALSGLQYSDRVFQGLPECFLNFIRTNSKMSKV